MKKLKLVKKPCDYCKLIKIQKILSSDGYYRFYDLSHPLAGKSGTIKYHRHVMSIKLGRWIKSEEHVHHVDGNKINNDPNNLIILNRKQHNRIHATGSIKKIITKRKCKQCGERFILTYMGKRDNQKYCSSKCYGAAICKKFDFSKDELEKLVWEIPATDIAKKYNINYITVIYWLEFYNIDLPTPGYWLLNANRKKVRERQGFDISKEELEKLVWETPLATIVEKYKTSMTTVQRRVKEYNICIPPLGYWNKKINRNKDSCQKRRRTRNMVKLRLDEFHYMKFHKGLWTLYVLKKVAEYTSERNIKYSSPTHKGVVPELVENNNKKYYAIWHKIGSYTMDNMGDALFTWLYQKMDSHFGNVEFSIKQLKDFYIQVREDFKIGASLLEGFRIGITVNIPDLEKLEEILDKKNPQPKQLVGKQGKKKKAVESPVVVEKKVEKKRVVATVVEVPRKKNKLVLKKKK